MASSFRPPPPPTARTWRPQAPGAAVPPAAAAAGPIAADALAWPAMQGAPSAAERVHLAFFQYR